MPLANIDDKVKRKTFWFLVFVLKTFVRKNENLHNIEIFADTN